MNCFGYLLEVYLGLVVGYPILVRVSSLSSRFLCFLRFLLERYIVLVGESILNKLCWVFSTKRVSHDKSCVYCGCISFNDIYVCSYCSNC
jgi:hypothetical protein